MTAFMLIGSFVIAVTIPAAAGAQAPGKRAPAPRPKPAEAVVPPLIEWDIARELGRDPSLMDLRAAEMELRAHEMELRVSEFALRDAERFALDAERLAFDFALPPKPFALLSEFDAERFARDAEWAAEHAIAAMPMPMVHPVPEIPAVPFVPPVAAIAPVPAIPPVPAIDHPMLVDHAMPLLADADRRFLSQRPPAPWASEDPADSLYRVAREALNRGEYRRAAQLFNEVTAKHPRSKYAQDCAYWEAFARYRTGTTDDLRQALRILDGINVEAMVRVGRETAIDIPALRARIQGALAARGDARAAEELKRSAGENNSCDREEISVRAEALSALAQMDPASAKPAIRKVLERHDECTVELRRRALYLVGRQADGESAAIILSVAKSDPNAGIRSEAMRWLPRVAGEGAVAQLQELLRTSTDEQGQRAAVYALASVDSDASRRAIRTIIERSDASERIRYDAIMSLAREREGRSPSAEDMAYVRSLYTKLETPRLREAVLSAVSRVSAPENEQFLLAVARNAGESSALRASALQRLGRMSSVSVADIARLYDGADARSLREQILSALAQRKEPEAIDKMMEIARKDTDPHIRRYAISLLARSNNERAKQLLKELIEQ